MGPTFHSLHEASIELTYNIAHILVFVLMCNQTDDECFTSGVREMIIFFACQSRRICIVALRIEFRIMSRLF